MSTKQYDLKRRRRFKRMGLRSDGKPLAKPKPCGCLGSRSCLKCRLTPARVAWEKKIAAMHADYQSGMSMGAVCRKYGRHVTSNIKRLFLLRGLPVRPMPERCRHQLGNGGCFKAVVPKTEKEIAQIIAGMTRFKVPPALKAEWRHWSFAHRATFIGRLRKKFPSSLPTGKYSANVIPFKYGSPAAMEIERKMNEGRNSQTKIIKIKPVSEGVIFDGHLWFFSAKAYYRKGARWRPGAGQTMLHHVLYAQGHGPVPARHLVIFKDGNKNNLDPGNLALLSMAKNAERNKTAGRIKKGALQTKALLGRFNAKVKRKN